MSNQQTKLKKTVFNMGSKDQRRLRALLKIELSTPETQDKGQITERIEWKLSNGRTHREFGPAIIYPVMKTEIWCINGSVHREDGPAQISECLEVGCSPKNHSHYEYFLHGNPLTESEFKALTSNK